MRHSVQFVALCSLTVLLMSIFPLIIDDLEYCQQCLQRVRQLGLEDVVLTVDLGAPLTTAWDSGDTPGVCWREFEHGWAAVNLTDAPAQVHSEQLAPRSGVIRG